MFKKKVLPILLLCIVFFVFMGCSSDNSSGGTGKEEQVKLVWWSHDGPAFVDANKKLIADYENENPNVKIELQIFPYDAMNQKLRASFAGGNAPDMVQIWGSWAPQLIESDSLSELPADDSGWVKENFYEASLGSYTKDEKIFGIPHEFNIENGGVLANPKMFENAGVEYPTTWDEFIDVAKTLTVYDSKGEIDIKGFEFIGNDNIMFTFLSLILQQEGTYLTEDGHVDFSTPEATNAMNELVKFVTEYKITDLSDFATTEHQDLFFKDKVAMAIRGPWSIAIGQDSYERDDFDYISMPSFTDNNHYFAAESGWGTVVSGQSKQQEAAWDFVRYISEKDQAKFFNLSTFSVPANKEVAEDPSFLEEAPMLEASINILPYGTFIGDNIDTDYLKKQVNDNFQLMASGKLPVEDGLKNIEDEVNKMIDK